MFLIMTFAAALFSTSARAFAPSRFASRTILCSSSSASARFVSSTSSTDGPMPYDDSKMPFYALGTNLALQVGAQGNLKTLLDEDELEIVLDAFTQTLKGTALVEPRTILSHYGPPLNALLSERNSRLTERIQKDGAEYIRKFLECSPEAMQTSSGLVYYEMTAGTGKQPTIKDSVEVHYHGSLTDGTVFDSSVERGQTITFPLSGVIKGWTEGLQLMKEGGKATLVIPPDLAYGDAGSGEVIPPGATLKFEVELFKVN